MDTSDDKFNAIVIPHLPYYFRPPNKFLRYELRPFIATAKATGIERVAIFLNKNKVEEEMAAQVLWDYSPTSRLEAFVDWIISQNPSRITNKEITYDQSPLGEYYSEILKKPFVLSKCPIYREMFEIWLIQDINVCKSYGEIHKMFKQKIEVIRNIYTKEIWEAPRKKRK